MTSPNMIGIFLLVLIIKTIGLSFFQDFPCVFFKMIRAQHMFLYLYFIKCPIYLDFHIFVSQNENFKCWADLII
jgi:hypothetical protein